ncbi:MAG: beta-lactamase family protein, partial [Rubrobacter sp.]|nr:beta-lactamase family protein [Rubrobacter sp.]
MRRSVRLLAAVTIAVLLASGVALAVTPTGTPPSGAQEKGRDAALDGALRSLVARHGGPPGVIAVVQRGQHREIHTFGVRNLKSGLPMRANDRMRIASTAKAFSGAVALSLVSKDRLSLNDKIGARLHGLPKSWHKITLRQLLNHTSGIPDFSLEEGYREAVFASLKKAPPPEKLLTYVYDE